MMSEKIRSLVQRDFGRIISCIMSTGNRDWFRNIVIPRQDRPLFLICYNIYQYIFYFWNYVSIVVAWIWLFTFPCSSILVSCWLLLFYKEATAKDKSVHITRAVFLTLSLKMAPSLIRNFFYATWWSKYC